MTDFEDQPTKFAESNALLALLSADPESATYEDEACKILADSLPMELWHLGVAARALSNLCRELQRTKSRHAAT